MGVKISDETRRKVEISEELEALTGATIEAFQESEAAAERLLDSLETKDQARVIVLLDEYEELTAPADDEAVSA